jgi:hypothetical protein
MGRGQLRGIRNGSGGTTGMHMEQALGLSAINPWGRQLSGKEGLR